MMTSNVKGIRDKFEEETDCSISASWENYGSYSDRYVEWLESKAKNLNIDFVSESIPTPMQFVKEKYGIKGFGETYKLGKISVHKCVLFMNEYVKKYYSH